MNYLSNLFRALDFETLRSLLIRLGAVVLCLTVHETSHGLAALALGDPTAKERRRISLNPLHHIDWFGLAMMLVAGFGWAKPVPVDPSYFRHPKRGMALTALAGPVSNFLLAWVLLLLVRFLGHGAATEILLPAAVLSVGLGVFNLIPVPPLDGSKILAMLLPDRAYAVWMRYERYGMAVLWALVLLDVGADALNAAIRWVLYLLCLAAGI